MNGEVVRGVQANLFSRAGPGVNHGKLVARRRVESGISEPQRRIVEGFGVIHPREPADSLRGAAGKIAGALGKAGPGSAEETRVSLIIGSGQQIRLVSGLAEIEINPAGAWVFPGEDRFQRPPALRFFGGPADDGKLLLQPKPVVQREVDRIEVGAAID